MQAPLLPDQLEACAGAFRVSRMLHVAVRLGLFEALARFPRSARSLAATVGTHPEATAALLDALAAWGLLARTGAGSYALTPVSRRLLPDAEDGVNLAQLVGWVGSDLVFDAWSGLEHTLRTGEGGLRRCGTDFHAWLGCHPALGAQYQAAMSSTQAAFEACASSLDELSPERVIDLGGGCGDLLDAVLARHPAASGLCIDLPHVVQGLPPRLGGRLQYAAGDLLEGPVPPDADLYLTSTVLRCFDDEEALKLLRSVRRAMTRADARLVCFEMVLAPHRDDPSQALADLGARVVYGGRDRTAGEFRELLARAGLCAHSVVPVTGTVHAIFAGAAGSATSRERSRAGRPAMVPDPGADARIA